MLLSFKVWSFPEFFKVFIAFLRILIKFPEIASKTKKFQQVILLLLKLFFFLKENFILLQPNLFDFLSFCY